MAELAKTHIEIVDESQYGSGVSSIIPFYIFATAQNKVIDEDTGEIAPGTTKETANEVMLLTSQQDVTQTYGVPYFETIDGTVQQGSELNEVGLYALYSGLGSASLAYALRADIDMAQLKATNEQPVGKVSNGTKWLDTSKSLFGLFRADGSNGYRGWESIGNVLLPSSNYINEDGKPISTYGKTGDVAFVCLKNEFKYFENIAQEWYQIGSEEWKNQFPSSITVNVTEVKVSESSIIDFMGNEITLNVNDTLKTLKTKIEELNNSNINVSYINGGKSMMISSVIGVISMTQKTGKALSEIGFEVDNTGNVVVESPSLVFASHTKVPSSKTAGTIWLKTTEPNYGASYVLKEYSKSKQSWVSEVLPMFGSFEEAELKLLQPLEDKRVIKYDSELLNAKVYRNNGGINEVSAKKISSLTAGNTLNIKTVSDGKSYEATVTVVGTDYDDFAKQINKAKLPNIVADVNGGLLRIVSSNGNVIVLENGIGNVLETMDMQSGEIVGNVWVEEEYIVSELEPTADPVIGTMWIDDDFVVDIMVNDGSNWRAYKSRYECADIFVTSEEPLEKANGEVLQENDLWLDTNDSNYPTIYRRISGEWVMVDNTDQTTPDGIIFADVRENAGPNYEGSKHEAFSTKYEDMMISDYVDPDCVNPLSYPADILLFNTMYSTNNVKEFTNRYENAVKTYGETFVVGDEKTAIHFPTPGTSSNSKTTRWSTKSGNALDGSGLFGRKAQRALVVKALAEAIVSNQDIRADDYDFFFVNCAGYPELDDEIANLNSDKKEMFYNVSDTPARLSPNANSINAWASNRNNASSHGEDGRVIRSAYQTRQYPPMGLTSNVDGSTIAVPSSITKMKNLLVLPRGRIAAGTQYGQVNSVSSVGYINSENEYASITVQNGLGEALVAQSINPIMPRRNTGLLYWGEATENPYTSALSDEHTILTILRLKRELDSACLPFFFQPNTQAVRNDFDATLRSILNDYVSREELYDYVLVTDNSVNTAERIERKELWGEIAVEAVKGIEQIYIPIRIVKTGSLSATN